MYEDPRVYEKSITVVFTFATDPEHEPEMFGDLVDRVNAVADELGYDAEIHPENMLADAGEKERQT